MLVQPGLSRTCSETTLFFFHKTAHILEVYCLVTDDDSRVILEPDGNEKTDFINASYIHVSSYLPLKGHLECKRPK